jgi:DNA adenine methylase
MTQAKMKVTAIAPWFGGKRTLAPTIVEELGACDNYFEPFCGSMAVLFAKEPSKQETVCDLHDELTNLAWVFQNLEQAEALYDRLSRTLFCESLLVKAKSALEGGNSDCAERAYWFFIHSWCARNGTSGSRRMSFQLAVRWTKNGGSPTVRFRAATESIPAWHERLRNVVILNRDAFDVLPSIPDEPGVAVYCDPPYLLDTRSGDGDGGYLHDFAAPDHSRLADLLRRFTCARVVVSYYDHPSLARLYDGWTKRNVFINKQLAKQNHRGARRETAPEVLLINGPSYAKTEAPSLF